MLLNTATIRIIYAIVSPCKLSAIDNHIRNFTQQPFILKLCMHYLNSLKQIVCYERMREVFSSATDTPPVKSFQVLLPKQFRCFFKEYMHFFFLPAF